MPAILFSICQALAVAGVMVAILALLLFPLLKKFGKHFSHATDLPPRKLCELSRLEQSVFLLASGAGSLLGLALVIAIVAGLWWSLSLLVERTSPAGFAIISILFGIAPFLLTVLAVALARLLGGGVNTAGAHNCYLLGFNLNAFIHSLFMSYWYVLFTGGIAILGLIGSGIWIWVLW